MKIIQLMAGNADDGHSLYGLGDDGSLYEFYYAQVARKHDVYNANGNGSLEVKFVDGNTAGWKLLCATGVMTKVIPHPDDPTKCERS